MKLEFGAGEKQTPGFKNVDVRDLPGIDYVCEAWKIDELVDENSVDQIHSRHFMEHLTYYHVDLTMSAWYKILKPGGFLTIVVPCMDFHTVADNNEVDRIDVMKIDCEGGEKDIFPTISDD